MKQIEYTEKQKLVIEIVDKFFSLFGFDNLYERDKKKLIEIKQKMYDEYEIKNKKMTLREYLRKHSIGAYHRFNFEINNGSISVRDIIGVSDFESIYNPAWLDKYYVIGDTTEEFGSNCENYCCKHYLKLTPKED